MGLFDGFSAMNPFNSGLLGSLFDGGGGGGQGGGGGGGGVNDPLFGVGFNPSGGGPVTDPIFGLGFNPGSHAAPTTDSLFGVGVGGPSGFMSGAPGAATVTNPFAPPPARSVTNPFAGEPGPLHRPAPPRQPDFGHWVTESEVTPRTYAPPKLNAAPSTKRGANAPGWTGWS